MPDENLATNSDKSDDVTIEIEVGDTPDKKLDSEIGTSDDVKQSPIRIGQAIKDVNKILIKDTGQYYNN